MKTSCFLTPQGNQFLTVWKWQIEACDGNHCAAHLLSVFGGWHDHKIASSEQNERMNSVRARHGEPTDEGAKSLLQWHTAEELSGYLFGLYKRDSIRDAIALLVKKGYVEVQRNPERKLAFDATKFFLLIPDAVNSWIREHYVDCSNPESQTIRPMCEKEVHRSAENQRPSSENRQSLDYESIPITQKACAPSDREPAKTTSTPKPAIPKPRNFSWEALAELDGWKDGDHIPPGSWSSRIGKCVKEAREFCPRLSNAELATEIKRRAKAYREKWPEMTITSTALMKHWMQFGESSQPNQGDDGPTLIFQADPSEKIAPRDAEAKRKRFGDILRGVGLKRTDDQ
jgi:hypothetical protein